MTNQLTAERAQEIGYAAPPRRAAKMPHDMNGTELKAGDAVSVPCKIKAIHLTEEYCNLDIETNISLYPTDSKTALTLNARQVRKASLDQLELLRASRVFLDWLSKKRGEQELPFAMLPPDAARRLVELIPKIDEVLDA